MGRLTRDGTAEPVSRDQILRREREREILIDNLITRLIHTLCRGEPGSALSGRYAPDSAMAERSSIVDEPGES